MVFISLLYSLITCAYFSIAFTTCAYFIVVFTTCAYFIIVFSTCAFLSIVFSTCAYVADVLELSSVSKAATRGGMRSGLVGWTWKVDGGDLVTHSKCTSSEVVPTKRFSHCKYISCDAQISFTCEDNPSLAVHTNALHVHKATHCCNVLTALTGPKDKRFLDALASLEFKLSVSE